MLQEVGQQAVAQKGLGDRVNLGGEGAPLLLAQTQALLGFFEKDLDGPAARTFVHHLGRGQGPPDRVSKSGSLYPLVKTMAPWRPLLQVTGTRRRESPKAAALTRLCLWTR